MTKRIPWNTLVEVRSGPLKGRMAYFDDNTWDEEGGYRAVVYPGLPLSGPCSLVKHRYLRVVTRKECFNRRTFLMGRLYKPRPNRDATQIGLDGLEFGLLCSGYGLTQDDLDHKRADE